MGIEPRTPQNLTRIDKSFVNQKRPEPLDATPDSRDYAKGKFRAKAKEGRYKEFVCNLAFKSSRQVGLSLHDMKIIRLKWPRELGGETGPEFFGATCR